MTILITGAAGFIGSHLSNKLLARGEKIFAIDNLNNYYDVQLKQSRLDELEKHENFTFYKADIADGKALTDIAERHKITHIINLAAQAGVRYSLENPQSYIKSNLDGFANILELCRNIKGFKHLVYASSSSVYGGNKKIPFSVKDNVDNPLSLYAATKKSNELLAHSYSHLFKIPSTGLRFFTVYGPSGRPDMATHLFTKAIFDGKPITVYNNGDMRRDFTYIDDIVSGIIAALDNPPAGELPYKIYNLGNNKPEELMDYVAVLEKYIGKKAIIDFKPMHPGDVKETYADITETTADLGYKPTTSIDEGLEKFVNWFKRYYF